MMPKVKAAVAARDRHQTSMTAGAISISAAIAVVVVGGLALTTGGCTSTSITNAASSEAAATGDGGGLDNVDPSVDGDAGVEGAGVDAANAHLPLTLINDAPLPGHANRFDYQDIDSARGHLVIAHMNDAAVVVVNLSDGSLAKLLPQIPTARGVATASDVGKIFVTSSPNKLVLIDSTALTEISRVDTGSGPDGVTWDPVHQTVGVSDQGDGAVSLIDNAGTGTRVQVPVGIETGNVVFDASRAHFWVTAVTSSSPDKLVEIDPVSKSVVKRIDLPGCSGAHGLRLHPDGASALIACEGNDKLARVELGGTHAIVTAATGAGPDVLSIDPGLGWLYVAAESGDLTVFDLKKPGLVTVGHQQVGAHAHSVAVDPATHRVFFPLVAGSSGTPVLRIMRPSGI